MFVSYKSKRCYFFQNESYFKKQETTHTIDHNDNDTVLPQPLVFESVKNLRNLENMKDDAHEDKWFGV
jgi:hypothetical protein